MSQILAVLLVAVANFLLPQIIAALVEALANYLLPQILAVLLVAVAAATCGSLALCLGCLAFFLRLFKM